MNPALARQPGVLRFNLSLPSTRIRLGPIAIDGVEALLGVSLASILDPLMPAPRFTRITETGGEVEVYPLAIPDGEGVSVPIKHAGEIGLRNLCCAPHKLRYAEPAFMRTPASRSPLSAASSRRRTPHNHSSIPASSAVGGPDA